MNLCVIGTGYVGLVGAAVFTQWGNTVFGVDIDAKKIGMIKKGVMPIYEPGLSKLVKEQIKTKRLFFTTNLAEGLRNADIVFICVGTPQDKTGAADLSAVWTVAQSISKYLKKGDRYRVVVTKSTVPVGTNEAVERVIRENAPKGVDFDVASNPEFLKEGYSIEDMQNADRTVVGSNSKKALGVLRKLYAHLGSPTVECDLRSAEMIKYASNAFLATKISFINEMAQICERAKADVSVVAAGMGLDRRIGKAFLNAGTGYGGSCFPKDVAALYRTSTDQAYDFKLLRGVMEVNERQKYYYISKITRTFGENLTGRTICVLGLAFKENTDDIRDSTAIDIVQILRGVGAALRVFDPQAMENAKKKLGSLGVYYAKSIDDAIKDADGLCILTGWEEFKALDLDEIKKLMRGNSVFDGRNLWDKDQVEKAGFIYHAIGKWTNGSERIGRAVTYTALYGNGSTR